MNDKDEQTSSRALSMLIRVERGVTGGQKSPLQTQTDSKHVRVLRSTRGKGRKGQKHLT